MKKIIILLILTIALFASDACKLDVYFGNGVWNDRWAAESSMKNLKYFVQKHNPDRFLIAEEDTTYSFNVAYNKGEGTIDDLLETFWQLHESGQVGDFYFGFITRILDAANILSHEEEEDYRSRMAAIAAKAYTNTQEILQLYRDTSLSNNNNVLLVAHSQGNLFANDAYSFLTDDEKKRFQVVGVGVPADHIATGNDYVTFTFDYVIQAVSGHLPANVGGFGHTFVNAYLDEANTDAATAMAAHIKNKVAVLDQNMCTKYMYFRFIAYLCPSELEVGIYGTKKNPISPNTLIEEKVATDARKPAPRDADGECTLTGDWDYITSVRKYDKGDCIAYTFDDTSGGYHSLDEIAAMKYENSYTCTTYEMSHEVYMKLISLEE